MAKDPSSDSKQKVKLPSVAFILCVIFAAIIWFFSTLSKEYTVTWEYQITCYDLPENKQSVTLSDSVLNLTFTGRGFNYLNPKYAEKNRKIALSINTLTQNNSKRNVYTFNRRVLTEYIRTKPGFDATFVDVATPESITIYLK